MPVVKANGIDINYEVQGEGEPMVLIPYLAAEQACYAFQVGEYAKHFTCYSIDPRGAGLSSKPEGEYTTELLADDVAAIFRLGRAKGVSLTTIDVLIAAVALEHRVSVFTLDKDFSRIASLTGLPLYPLPAP